jgi:O-antigen/teichoic acid export membrane protein
LRSIFYTLLPFAAGQGAALGSLLVLASSLPAADFGRFSFGLVCQSYIVLLGSAGLRTLLVREATRDVRRFSTFLTTHVVTSLSLGTAAAAVAMTLAAAWPGIASDERTMHAWLAAGGWFATLNVSPFFDARHAQPVTQAITACSELLGLGALVLAREELSLPVLGGVFAAKWAASSVAHLVVLACRFGPLEWRLDRRLTVRLWRSGLPLLLPTLVATWPIGGTVVLVRHWNGPEATAVIGLAAQFTTGFLMVAGVGFRLVQPSLATPEDLHDPSRLRHMRRVALVLVVVWAGLLTCLWLLVRYWLPPEFREGDSTMALLMVSGLVGGLAYLGWACLLATGRERWVVWSYLAGNVTFLALAWPLTARWCGFGAAVASAIAMMTIASLMWLRLSLSRRGGVDLAVSRVRPEDVYGRR